MRVSKRAPAWQCDYFGSGSDGRQEAQEAQEQRLQQQNVQTQESVTPKLLYAMRRVRFCENILLFLDLAKNAQNTSEDPVSGKGAMCRGLVFLKPLS